jgi:hypothetical protein
VERIFVIIAQFFCTILRDFLHKFCPQQRRLEFIKLGAGGKQQ